MALSIKKSTEGTTTPPPSQQSLWLQKDELTGVTGETNKGSIQNPDGALVQQGKYLPHSMKLDLHIAPVFNGTFIYGSDISSASQSTKMEEIDETDIKSSWKAAATDIRTDSS